MNSPDQLQATAPTPEPDRPAPVAPGIIEVFPVMPQHWPIVPGRLERPWMEAYPQRHAYRCLPLNMANTTGWEILCPVGLTAEWNGGPLSSDITIVPDDPGFPIDHLASGHFAFGIMTFHVSYLFRTAPGWRLWVMGPPNWPKDGIYPLQGLVETDWLPFPFTMNWHFTRPHHKVRFEQFEPIAFVTLMHDAAIEEAEPQLRYMTEEPALLRQYEGWRESRTTFNEKLHQRDEATIKAGWQRHYFVGERPDDPSVKSLNHVNRRRLKPLGRVDPATAKTGKAQASAGPKPGISKTARPRSGGGGGGKKRR